MPTVTLLTKPYDKFDKTADKHLPEHGVKSKENEAVLKEIRSADGIKIGTIKGGEIATRSELFQNIGNSIVLLKEAHKHTKTGFNANKLLFPLSKDQANQDVEFTHTRRWLASDKCSLNPRAKADVMVVLDGCKKVYDTGKNDLHVKGWGEFSKREDVNGLNRLVETKMSKATLYASPEVNKAQQKVCEAIKNQWSPKEWDKIIDKWLQKRPSEFPVGRLQASLNHGDKKTPTNSAKARFDKNGEFDVAQFISFHRFLSKNLSEDVTDAQKESYHYIKDKRGDVPAVETPKGRKNAHKLGITLRNVSTESLAGLTDKHTRPVDYKRADMTRPAHLPGVYIGYPLACGLSGTTNVHLFGLYQGHCDAVDHYYDTGENRGILSEESLRGFMEMLSSTLCLDGGHSRFEVFTGAATTIEAMRNMDPPLEYPDFVDRLDNVVKGFMNDPKLYDNHYKALIDDGLMDKSQLHDSFTDSLVQLRNGRSTAKENILHLHYEDMNKKAKIKPAKAENPVEKPKQKSKASKPKPTNNHSPQNNSPKKKVKPVKDDWITKFAKFLLT